MASNDVICRGATHAFLRKILFLLLGLLLGAVIAGLAPSTARADDYYDVWVGDVHVSSANHDNVLKHSHNGSTGKVSFKMVDSSQGHAALYLDNANIKVANDGVDHSNHAAGIFVRSDIKRLDVYLIGKNTITVPSGALSSGNIYGIASFASASDDSTIGIYPKQTGASLSMTLSGDNSDVYGIYNNNDGVEIEGVTLSAVLSSGGDACGICGYDGNVDIAKATVNMSISGDESVDGIRAGSSVLIGKSTVDLSLGQNKKSSYGACGVYIKSNIGGFYVMSDSTVVIDIGESSDYNYGVNNKGFVRVEGDSALHVNVGYAPNNSIGMLGSNLFVEDGSAAGFSGYTQAIRSSVVIDSNTQSLGAFVNTSPTFRGGGAWNGLTPLSSYKYVHFPKTLNVLEAIIGAIANQKYTGKAITPPVTVRFGNTVLAKTTDYVVSYANNVKPGKATVTIMGKGVFKGTKTATFTISRKSCNVKSLWASKHEIGYVTFKWTKESAFNPKGWMVKYRTKKIGSGSWGEWATKPFGASTYQFKCPVKANHVIEIHAKEINDASYSQGIITTPAGGKYQAMKTVYVKNAATNKRVTSISVKVGKSVKLRPDYEYPVKDYRKRPRLYPTQALWDLDAAGKTLVTIAKPNGAAYTGGMIDGAATITGKKAGTTNLICRAPNGRTKVVKVTVTK